MQEKDKFEHSMYSGKTEHSPARKSNKLMVPVISSKTSRWNEKG